MAGASKSLIKLGHYSKTGSRQVSSKNLKFASEVRVAESCLERQFAWPFYD